MRARVSAREVGVEQGLFVAGRGAGEGNGLHHFARQGDVWHGTQLATVEELAALCWHPTLPVIYGLSGLGRGLMHAWDVASVPTAGATELATLDCLGEIPCDLAVDPTGRMLVAANFGSGSLSVWRLDARGAPIGDGESLQLEGASFADPDKQAAPHPHQIIFTGGMLYVPDFGADLVRVFAVDPLKTGAAALIEVEGVRMPPGTAPRHLAVIPEQGVSGAPRVVVSGELASTIVAGRADSAAPSWSVVPGTQRTGLARTRHPRNYPGDIKLSTDSRIAYFANRGYDTISAFALDDVVPRLIREIDSGTYWPQHLLVVEGALLVAGWDSGTVSVLPLVDGIPGEASVLFHCEGAAWLLPDHRR